MKTSENYYPRNCGNELHSLQEPISCRIMTAKAFIILSIPRQSSVMGQGEGDSGGQK